MHLLWSSGLHCQLGTFLACYNAVAQQTSTLASKGNLYSSSSKIQNLSFKRIFIAKVCTFLSKIHGEFS